ncbi:MAG: amino acid permease [Legionellaceae bacterium]|nr:amino acid permease [Legionellaceae bacterium]
MKISRNSNKPLSLFSLVMINIIAVDSLRTLPIGADYGFSLIVYYVLAAFLFFIPVALVAAELATAMPQTGGLYIWVREAFGLRAGFITIWLQWIYNVVWYPTIMVFIVSALAYLFEPSLGQNKYFLLPLSMLLFWTATLLNCLGMRVSSLVSIIGAIVGTIVPLFLIICLAAYWLLSGHVASISLSWDSLLPDWHNSSQIVMLGGILFGLIGMEMSAVHAGDVVNPQRDYPKALLWSTILIFFSLLLGSLAIAIVVPKQNLDIVTGLMTAFSLFLPGIKHSWLMSAVVLMIFIGAMSSVSTWVMGPARGLMISARDGCLPALLARTNRYGAPYSLLILQAILFTLLCGVYIFFDDISVSYWLLSDLTAQLALLAYVFMFAAVMYLRWRFPTMIRPFRIPGRDVVCYLVAGTGLVTCLVVIASGFIPPARLSTLQKWYFESFLLFGLVLFFVIPWYVAGRRQKSIKLA